MWGWNIIEPVGWKTHFEQNVKLRVWKVISERRIEAIIREFEWFEAKRKGKRQLN